MQENQNWHNIAVGPDTKTVVKKWLKKEIFA